MARIKTKRIKGEFGQIMMAVPSIVQLGSTILQGKANAEAYNDEIQRQNKLSFLENQYKTLSNQSSALQSYYDARRQSNDDPDYAFNKGGIVSGKDLHITSGGKKHNIGRGYYLLSGRSNDGIYGYVGNKKTGPKVALSNNEIVGPSSTSNNSLIVLSDKLNINGETPVDMVNRGVSPEDAEIIQEMYRNRRNKNTSPVGRIHAIGGDNIRVHDRLFNKYGYSPEMLGFPSPLTNNNQSGLNVGSYKPYLNDINFDSLDFSKPLKYGNDNGFWAKMGMKPYGANFLATGTGLLSSFLARKNDRDSLNFVNEKYGRLYNNLLGSINNAAEAKYFPQQYRDRTAWWELAKNNRDWLNLRDKTLENTNSTSKANAVNQETYNDKVEADSKTIGESRKGYLDWSDAERRTMAEITAQNAASKNQLMASTFNTLGNLVSNWSGERNKIGNSNVNFFRNLNEVLHNDLYNPSIANYEDEQRTGLTAMLTLARATDPYVYDRLRSLMPTKWNTPTLNKYLREHYEG